MDEPRWLVDEMLGRLARYLRFLGYDTVYVHGATDSDIFARAHGEGRRLVTRDRSLAARATGSILLTRTDISGQMRELVGAFPSLRRTVRFDRCSVCNGRLLPVSVTRGPVSPDPDLPPDVRSGLQPLYSCRDCGHLFWDGSHTRSVRARLEQWFAETRPG